MRVTAQMIIDSAIKHMEQNRRRLLEVQEAVSSGLRFAKPSEDPPAAVKAMEINALLDRLDQYEKSVDTANSFLEETERALNGAYELVTQAWQIAIDYASSGDSEGRQIAAGQVSLIFDQLINETNSRIGDRYIFGGYVTGTPPFDTSGNYNGDSGSIEVRTGTNSTMVINFNGDDVFKGTAGGVDILTAVKDLETALQNDDTDGIENARSILSLAIDQIVSYQSRTGVRLNRLDSAKQDLAETRFQMTDLLANTTSADITEAAAELAVQENLFEASLAATSQVLQISLLSFIS